MEENNKYICMPSVDVPEIALFEKCEPTPSAYKYVYNIVEILWKGYYNPNSFYLKGQQVSYLIDGVLSAYIALQDVPNFITPANPLYWDLHVTGVKGEQGEVGPPIKILGSLDDASELPIDAEVGDAYLIDGDIYTYSGTWINAGRFKGEDGDDAFEVWLRDNPTGTYEDWEAYLQAPALQASEQVQTLIQEAVPILNSTIEARDETIQATSNVEAVIEEAQTAIQETETATSNANTATNNAVTATSQANTATSQANTATSNANTATNNANNATTNANQAAQTANNARGWQPEIGVVDDGTEREVQTLVRWIGGTGTAPNTNVGKYVGTTGYVDTKAEATNVKGEKGNKGWTPNLRDEEYEYSPTDIRIIRKLVGYINGEGAPPDDPNIGLYIKGDGTYTAVKADATNYKGGSFVVGANSLVGNDTGTAQAPKNLAPVGIILKDSKAYNAVESEGSVASSKIILGANILDGLFRITGGAEQGALKIKLPTTSTNMLTIQGIISFYDDASISNRTCFFLITAYPASMTNMKSAVFIGAKTVEFPVRWYIDTDGSRYIAIADLTQTWNRVSFVITNVIGSHDGATLNNTLIGWKASLITAFTGTIQGSAVTATLPKASLQNVEANYINKVGNQSILGSLALGESPSSINGTELIKDKYAGGSLTSIGVMRSEGALYFARGLKQKENDTGFVSTMALNQAKTALLIKMDGIYYIESPASSVPIGDAVTGLITYKVWTAKDTNIPAFTATKLLTPVMINGVPFDGTAPITIYDNTKQPLEAGKGLSTNDFTETLKNKLMSIDANHYLAPIQSIALLKAMPQASISDKARIFVEDERIDYFYDAQSTGDEPEDEAPNDQVGGVGFWRQIDLRGETAVSIMTKYESLPDRNPLTDVRRIKLDSVQSGATANDTDANLKNRANHTGTQLAVTISDFDSAALVALATALALKANLVSPIFTGTPSLPTGTTGVKQTLGNNTLALATTSFVAEGLATKAGIRYPSGRGTITANITLALTDENTYIRVSGNRTITVPPFSSVAFAYGTRIDFLILASSVGTFIQGSGVTIISKTDLVATGWVAVTIINSGTNTWDLIGNN